MLKNLLRKSFKREGNSEQTNQSAEEKSLESCDGDFLFCVKEKLVEKRLRLIIVAENDRRLLFDSRTILPVDVSNSSANNARTSSCGRFKLLRHRPDIPALSQMMFGSMSSVKKGTLKIHYLNHTKQLLVSRIISVPRAKTTNRISKAVTSASSADSLSPQSTVRSLDGMRRHNHSQNLDPPRGFARVRNASLQLEGDSSDVLRTFSPSEFFKYRRIQLSQKADLSDESNSRSRYSSLSSMNDDDCKYVAIGLLFREEERLFILVHFPLIEIELLKLEAEVIKASLSKTQFLKLLHEGWMEAARNIRLLYNSPRIHFPVWLSLADSSCNRALMLKNFCSNMFSIISNYDSKTTHYFVSNLLSCVLMNHLSWVASVAPRNYHRGNLEQLDFALMHESTDSMKFPYNIHLAQHLELNGCIGNALRAARIVIVGNNENIINRLIHLLTYFIRCSGIHFNTFNDEQWQFDAGFRVLSPTILQKCDEEPNVISGSHSNDSDDLMSSEDEYDPNWHIPVLTAINGKRSSDLAHSLMAGTCESFCPHFIISGLKRDKLDAETILQIVNHVKKSEREMVSAASRESSSSSLCENSALAGSVVIIADINSFTIRATTGNEANLEDCQMYSPCDAVVSMLEQFGEVYKLGTAPSLLIDLIENCLSDILGKSLSLVELLTNNQGDMQPSENSTGIDNCISVKSSPLTSERIVNIIGCDHSDLRLIANVAAVYYPSILQLLI